MPRISVFFSLFIYNSVFHKMCMILETCNMSNGTALFMDFAVRPEKNMIAFN